VKLKAKGTEHAGIEPAVKRKIMQTISTLRGSFPSSDLDSTDQSLAVQMPRKRLRRSADRDMSNSFLSAGNTISMNMDTRMTRRTSTSSRT
jgi:hypothetical protein